MIPLPLLSSVYPEFLEGCACSSVNSTDPYEARQDATEKMLLQELEAQSHNTDICDSETIRTDTSDNEYVPSEQSDHEQCNHVCTPETDSDGDNVTASGDSDADRETDGSCEAKHRQFGINYPLL